MKHSPNLLLGHRNISLRDWWPLGGILGHMPLCHYTTIESNPKHQLKDLKSSFCHQLMISCLRFMSYQDYLWHDIICNPQLLNISWYLSNIIPIFVAVIILDNPTIIYSVTSYFLVNKVLLGLKNPVVSFFWVGFIDYPGLSQNDPAKCTCSSEFHMFCHHLSPSSAIWVDRKDLGPWPHWNHLHMAFFRVVNHESHLQACISTVISCFIKVYKP